jgi:flagellar brake protein
LSDDQTQQAAAHQGGFENYDLISDPVRIDAALAEIQRHAVLVSVRVDDRGPVYDSRIRHLDPAQRVFFLERLEPPEEETRLRVDQDIYVFATMRGIAVRFAATVGEIQPPPGEALYSCGYPERLLYLQRRDLFRVPLPRSDRRTLRIRLNTEGQEIKARVMDLSIKGLCLEVAASEIAHQQVGLVYQYRDLDLPDSRVALAGEATLVNLRPSTTPGQLAAGFAISDPDPLTERALMRAALYYQREILHSGD